MTSYKEHDTSLQTKPILKTIKEKKMSINIDTQDIIMTLLKKWWHYLKNAAPLRNHQDLPCYHCQFINEKKDHKKRQQSSCY